MGRGVVLLFSVVAAGGLSSREVVERVRKTNRFPKVTEALYDAVEGSSEGEILAVIDSQRSAWPPDPPRARSPPTPGPAPRTCGPSPTRGRLPPRRDRRMKPLSRAYYI